MKSAFLAIDVQRVWAENSPRTTQAIREAADLARPVMPVIWAYKDLLKNPALIQARDIDPGRDFRTNFRQAARLVPALPPSSEDWILPKGEMSVFSNPYVEKFLRERGIGTLLVSGFMTEQCVYHSVMDGIEKGFGILVIKDTTADSRDRYETDIETLFHRTGAFLSDMREFKKEGLALLNKRNEPVCC